MSRRVLMGALLMVVLIPAWGATGLPERVDSLLARFRDGDEAAKTGAVAETLALGEPAVRELYRRLSFARDFGGAGFSLPSPAAIPSLRSDRAVSIEVAIWQPKGEGWGGPDDVARIIEDVERYKDSESCQMISAPRLTTYEGQLANVTVARRQAYKRGGDATGELQLGLMVEMRAFVEDPGNRVTLDLRVVHAELAGELGVVETARGEVEVPQLLKRESGFVLTLEAGKRSGIRLPPIGDRGPLAILIRADPVRLDEINLVPEDD